VPYVLATVEKAVERLDGVPLIGFSGAPFTLASYVIEGSASRDFQQTKRVMYEQPETWRSLMSKLTLLVRQYLTAQVKSGADCIQLFDSWVGCLSPEDYRVHVKEYTTSVFDYLSGTVPRIHFCANSSSLVEEFSSTGCDVLSVDWRFPIADVWRRSDESLAVQGNLDPVAALSGGNAMEAGVSAILRGALGKKGHIFSLGHGVLRETPPEHLQRIVQRVHSETEAS
jgi:uroporphyrinogen decarboxylase